MNNPKRAILQVADTGPLESLVVMLNAVGYECFLPDNLLKNQLRHLGCDTVLDVDDLVANWGYDRPFAIHKAGPNDMDKADLYVDIKAHRCYDKVVRRWPNLAGKVLWYRINGGKPEHVVNAHGDHGDEVNPPCPVLTPNQWYRNVTYGSLAKHPEDNVGRAYACWPPFYRFNDYAHRKWPDTKIDFKSAPSTIQLTEVEHVGKPLCFVHNLPGWGYGQLIEPIHTLGVRLYGRGSPDGMVPHCTVPTLLCHALAMVHLKSSDAPGYALYEALAAGCPIICPNNLIWKNRMEELLIPGETCLTFGPTGHQALTQGDLDTCVLQINQHLKALNYPEENKRLGLAGRAKLLELMWSVDRPSDVTSLQEFMLRNFHAT